MLVELRIVCHYDTNIIRSNLGLAVANRLDDCYHSMITVVNSGVATGAIMDSRFGETLRRLRLQAGYGLRRFAELIEIEPSNLSAIEHGRRAAPEKKLREIADALGLAEDSAEWRDLFDSAARDGELPADVRHVANRRLVPALLRTIDNRQLSDEEISELIGRIQTEHGESPDDSA